MTDPAVTSDLYKDWPVLYPNRRAMGYLCTYVPEEIIHAAGFTPIRLAPDTAPATRADAHLQSYTCCVARSCLHQALSGKLAFLEGVVFAHTCDTMQGLADIWPAAFPELFVETLVSPVVLNGPHSRAYLVAELARFRRALERRWGVTISDEALRASIRVYNARRRALAAFYAQRESYSAAEWFSVINAALVTPAEEVPEWKLEVGRPEGGKLEVGNSKLEVGSRTPEGQEIASPEGGKPEGGNPNSKIRIALLGSTLDEPTLPQILDDLGAQVVADDFCNGARYFDILVAEEGDPLVALADRELTRRSCPCKHRGLEQRIAEVLELVRKHRADGVIFFLKKFCDPHAWDRVPLAAALDRAHIPHLTLETEQLAPEGPTRTRVEAFLEMLAVP